MIVVDTYLWQKVPLKKLPWKKGVFIKFGQFFLMWIFGPSFYILNFLVGSWNVGLNLGLQNYKWCSFGCGIFFNSKNLCPSLKMGFSFMYTLHIPKNGWVYEDKVLQQIKIGDCICTKFYNYLNLIAYL
jgi:hypothetical protein